MNSKTGPERLEGVTGRHWHGLDDGRIQCDVCPRYCKFNEGQRGLCFVRGRQEDAILLTTYGRSSGFCVDPIEKKPLNHDGRCGDCGSTIPGLFAPASHADFGSAAATGPYPHFHRKGQHVRASGHDRRGRRCAADVYQVGGPWTHRSRISCARRASRS